MSPSDHAEFACRAASELRAIADLDPTIADALHHMADELDPPSRIVSIFPRSAVLIGSVQGRSYPSLKLSAG